MPFSTSSVTVGYTTKKSNYDSLLNNIREIASATFTFTEQKTFLSAPMFGVLNSNEIESKTATSGIKYECGYRSGTVELKKTIREKVINIGSWNMSGTTVKSATHGLSDISKIREATAIVFNDSLSETHDLIKYSSVGSNFAASIYYITTTSVILIRYIPGPFVSADFNDTSINRGFIRILFEE